jgi:hypothetical protein
VTGEDRSSAPAPGWHRETAGNLPATCTLGDEGVPAVDAKRYSPLDRDEVHADMAADPAATRRAVATQPAVAAAHRDCGTCAELLPVAVPARLGKLRLSMQELSDALGLPPGVRLLRMYVTDDPHDLCVVVEGAELEPVPDGQEAPHLHL